MSQHSQPKDLGASNLTDGSIADEENITTAQTEGTQTDVTDNDTSVEKKARNRDIRRSKSAPDTLNSAPSDSLRDHVAKEIQKVLDGEFPEARERIRQDVLANPDALPVYDQDLEGSRAHTTGQLQMVLESKLPHGAFRTDQGGTGETGQTLTSIEMLGHIDLSLMVKAGVQWGDRKSTR